MNTYSGYQMVKDIVTAIITSDVLKYLSGALISLLGILLAQVFSDWKNKKDKKVEILENIRLLSSEFGDLVVVYNQSKHLQKFSVAALQLSLTKNADLSFVNIFKEEIPRWIGERNTTKRQLIGIKAKLDKYYLLFVRFFGEDEIIRSLLDELTKDIEIEFSGYQKVDEGDMVQIKKENEQLIKTAVKEVMDARVNKLSEALKKKIIGIK